mmetsp:Transcript_34800/g.61576  ORF Transcript_34800/g.61576 Transcript_34800/m.61576 type:complete len:230 (-) Transcript_34800:59-748(-)
MGSREDAIVPYATSRSRSRSRSRRKSRRSPSRSRSRKNGDEDRFRPGRGNIASEKVEQKKFAKKQAAAAVQAAQKSLETAQKTLETAISNDLEADKQLQQAMSEASRVDQEERIQRLVDERQEKRVKKDFDGADRIRQELRGLGVEVNDADLSWTGPDGMQGAPRRQTKPPVKGSGRGDRGGGRDRRRSPSYRRRDDSRDRGGGARKRNARRDESSYSASPSPPRRGRR